MAPSLRPTQYAHPFPVYINRRTTALKRTPTEQDDQLADVVNRERPRLRSFIRRRVADPRDAEDILQDVFHTLVRANRMLMPIDHVTGWLYRVARNRIVDLFRERTPEPLLLEDLLPSPDAGPEAAYARTVLLEALEQAIAELPAEQRDVFIAHELDGRSFKEMAAATGVSVNTLLSRKRYAVLRLRERLRSTYDDMTKS
jgi:RNA polymerase sigma factor (sigma-70 family)